MLAYMNDATDPLSAYPALWAPFVGLEKELRRKGQPLQAFKTNAAGAENTRLSSSASAPSLRRSGVPTDRQDRAAQEPL